MQPPALMLRCHRRHGARRHILVSLSHGTWQTQGQFLPPGQAPSPPPALSFYTCSTKREPEPQNPTRPGTSHTSWPPRHEKTRRKECTKMSYRLALQFQLSATPAAWQILTPWAVVAPESILEHIFVTAKSRSPAHQGKPPCCSCVPSTWVPSHRLPLSVPFQ